MEKIRWTRSEEVLSRVGERRCLMGDIWRRKRRWIENIKRSEGLLRTALEGKIQGKTTSERKIAMLLDDIKQKKSFQSIKRTAQNRGCCKRFTCA